MILETFRHAHKLLKKFPGRRAKLLFIQRVSQPKWSLYIKIAGCTLCWRGQTHHRRLSTVKQRMISLERKGSSILTSNIDSLWGQNAKWVHSGLSYESWTGNKGWDEKHLYTNIAYQFQSTLWSLTCCGIVETGFIPKLHKLWKTAFPTGTCAHQEE